MKHLAAALLSLVLIFTTIACSPAESSDANTENAENNGTTFTTEANDIDVNKELETEDLFKQEIYNSVSSLISSDILHDEEYYSTYNFTDDGTLFFFQFYIFGNQRRLIYLLKSIDNGKTWESEDIHSTPCMYWREHIICAKMLNESIGLISGRLFATDNNFSERTYITTNGGQDWTQIVLPATPPYLSEESALSTYLDGEAYDLTCKNGAYDLYVRITDYDPDLDNWYYRYFCYSSTDLSNWTFVESTKNS